MTGLMPESISSHLKIFEPGRQLDDYGTAVIRSRTAAWGPSPLLQTVRHGRENDLFIEIDGTKGLARVAAGRTGGTKMTLRRTVAIRMPFSTRAICQRRCTSTKRAKGLSPRLPAIPAFFEAFANVYRSAFDSDGPCAPRGKKFAAGRLRSIPTSTTAWKECILSLSVAESSQENARLPLKHAGSARAATGREIVGAVSSATAPTTKSVGFIRNRKTENRKLFSDFIQQDDPAVWTAIEEEIDRQHDGLEMIASENYTSPAIMEAAVACSRINMPSGYPGR